MTAPEKLPELPELAAAAAAAANRVATALDEYAAAVAAVTPVAGGAVDAGTVRGLAAIMRTQAAGWIAVSNPNKR